METQDMNILVNILLASIVGISAIPAQAQAEVATARVRTSDLDLSDAKGVATLERRVGRAVRSVCSSGGRSLQEKGWERSCRRQASAAAAQDMRRAIHAAAFARKPAFDRQIARDPRPMLQRQGPVGQSTVGQGAVSQSSVGHRTYGQSAGQRTLKRQGTFDRQFERQFERTAPAGSHGLQEQRALKTDY
jgi:UrcA family protein